MNKILSNKIKIANILMIILVILLHSYNLSSTNFQNYAIIYKVEEFFSDGICRIAVPVLGIISGFLFFYFKDDYYVRLKKRFKSIAIPYLIIFMSWIIILITINILLKKSIDLKNINMLANKYSYHLWYIRDLFIITIISPIISVLINKFEKYTFLVCITLVIFNKNIYFLHLLIFFILGAILSNYYEKNDTVRKALNSNEYNKYYIFVTGLLWIISVLSYIVSDVYIIKNISIVIGIIFIFQLLNKIYENIFLIKIGKYSFFIYLFHEPTITILKKVLQKVGQENIFMMLVTYFISPIIVIIILYYLSIIMRSKMPRIYNILTGSRTKKESKN